MTLALQYLLDTDMCIYLLNGDERIKSRVAQVGVEAISVSIKTLYKAAPGYPPPRV